MVRTHTVHDLLRHESGLFRISHTVQHPYLFSLLPFRIAFLGDAAFVVGDDAVRGIDYGLSRAVIAFQADYLAIRVILLEIQDVLDLRAAESVDGLGIVSDHADIAVKHRQLPQNDILREVGVLILVHHNI